MRLDDDPFLIYNHNLGYAPREDVGDSHPFTYEVMTIHILTNFKFPTKLEPYYGSTNPKTHLEGFQVAMLLSGAPDALMCCAFFTTLKKASI